MKAEIIITDDRGNSWRCELPISNLAAPSSSNPKPKRLRVKDAPPAGKALEHVEEVSLLDLSLPIRPFIKTHARAASGPQKFTLLLAHIAGGDLSTEVPSSGIEKQWNKMTTLMGGTYNGAYGSRARDNGWVDSPKFGMYKLLPGWKRVLSNV